MCGLCAAHPEVYTQKVDYQTSVELFKDNRVWGGEQCTLEEQQEPEQWDQKPCGRPLRKHKVTNHIMH